MARSFFGLSLRLGARRSLSARGQRLNTFAGMGFSVAFLLLALGGYLIVQQFANPMQAQPLNLPLAALLITTGLTLFFGLVHPWKKLPHDIAELPAVYWEEKNVAVARSSIPTRESERVPVARRYVDRARIYIRR